MKKTILLQSIGHIDPVILLKLRKDLERWFKVYDIRIKILSDEIPLSDLEYNSNRRQYNASLIKDNLRSHVRNKKYFRTLGIIDEDIFAKDFNFVFGIAEMPKMQFHEFSGTALISLIRLSEKFYERAENFDLFELRTLKEAIHELGHTFGLEHCENFCIMQFSNCLADTDEKPPNLCESCSIKMKHFFSTLI